MQRHGAGIPDPTEPEIGSFPDESPQGDKEKIAETEAERDAGRALDVVKGQVAGSLPEGANSSNTVIAYEPVWAIGTGRTPTNQDVADVHTMIREELGRRFGSVDAAQSRILYGGSMKPSNAAELLAIEDVDGGLIGGASLKLEDFWGIVQTCL